MFTKRSIEFKLSANTIDPTECMNRAAHSEKFVSGLFVTRRSRPPDSRYLYEYELKNIKIYIIVIK